MSAITDFLQKQLDLTKDQVNALNSIASIVTTVEGVIGGVQGAVNFVTSILTMLGIISAPVDELHQVMQQILSAFQTLLSATDQEILMLAIAPETSKSESALSLLQTWMENNPSGDPSATTGDQAWIVQRSSIDSDSNLAAHTLNNPAYWSRPYYPELVYSDGWVGNLVPPSASDSNTPASSGGMVFDYRLALPAYLQVIAIRLAIVGSLNRTLGQGTKDELAGYVSELTTYYTTIRSGLVEHPAPGPDAVLAHYESPAAGSPGGALGLIPTGWALAGIQRAGVTYTNLFGAVDIYSTYSVVDSWPATEVPGGVGLEPLTPVPTPPTPQYPPFSYPKFLVRHLVRTMTRWKTAYRQIGLAQTEALIKQLNQLAGSPAPPLEGPTGDWSLKELGQRLSGISGSGFTTTGAPGSVQISARLALKTLQTTNPQPYPSLRAALAQ